MKIREVISKNRVALMLGIGLLLIAGVIVLDQLRMPLAAEIVSAGVAVVMILALLQSIKSQKVINDRVSAMSEVSQPMDYLEQLSLIEARVQEARNFVDALRDDETLPSFQVLDQTKGMGASLISLQQKLARFREDERKRSWAQGGLAKFSELLKQGKTLEEFSTTTLSHLVKYVQANQGGLFVMDDSDEHGKYMFLSGCYAYDRKKYINIKIREGEGLLGECMLSKSMIFLTDVPKEYVHITSGLGEALPRNLVIVPLNFNGEFYGAIELASFHVLQPFEIDFLSKVSENIAAEIATRRSVQDTEMLLKESTRLTQELQAHEEEMRLHVEELTATQEEMERKQAELSSVFSAIDNTVASLEFDINGRITKANSIFTSVSGFAEGHILTYDYFRLLPEQERDKPQHHMMWDNLRAGKFFSGEFRLVNRNNEEMWLNGTFNPIFNSKSQVTKVIMIAQFTTQEKAKQNELHGIINAVKNSMAYLELDGNFACKSANERFLKAFGIKRLELKDKVFCSLLEKDANEEFVKSHLSLVPQQYYEADLFFRLNGQAVAMRTSFTPIRDHNQKVQKIVVLINSTAVGSKMQVAAVA